MNTIPTSAILGRKRRTEMLASLKMMDAARNQLLGNRHADRIDIDFTMGTPDGFVRVTNKTVAATIKRYRKALKQLDRHPRNTRAMQELTDAINEFRMLSGCIKMQADRHRALLKLDANAREKMAEANAS